MFADCRLQRLVLDQTLDCQLTISHEPAMTASSPVINVDPDGEVFIVIPSPAAPSRLSLTHQDAAGKATSTIATEDDVATEDASTLDTYSPPVHLIHQGTSHTHPHNSSRQPAHLPIGIQPTSKTAGSRRCA